jgi:hypothetical protein
LGYNSWYVEAYFDPYSGIVLVTTGLKPNVGDRGFNFSPLNPYALPMPLYIYVRILSTLVYIDI